MNRLRLLLLFAKVLFLAQLTQGQCIGNTSPYGSATAPSTAGASATISACNYQTEYSTVTGIVTGNTYTLTYSLGGFITVESSTGQVLAFGNAPLTFTSTFTGTIYVNYNTNSGCGTATSCGTSTIQTVTVTGGGGGGTTNGCTNTSSFGSISAPTNNTAATISSCNYQTEYSTVSNIVAGNTYQLGSSCGGFITIHSGTFNGPVVASGNAPLTFTPATSGTYFIHYNTNSNCGTATNCCTTTITCTSCSPTGGCAGGSANSSCNLADPFCTGNTYNYCNTTSVPTLGSSGIYGCLLSTPNPAFYYLNVATSGNIVIGISQTSNAGAPIDVDYVVWGPFSSQAAMCPGLSANNIVSCSYSTAAVETATINNAIAGQWYMLLITNFSGVAGNIVFNQTGGAGATNCNIVVPNPCAIANLTATPTACNTSNTYSVNGTVSYSNPPTTGTLTVSSSCGGTQAFNAPFGTSVNYSLTGLVPNGNSCTVTASFSATACSSTQNYTAPNVPVVTASNQAICSGATINIFRFPRQLQVRHLLGLQRIITK